MCKKGQKIWFWTCMGTRVISTLLILAIAGGAYLWSGKYPENQVLLPPFSLEESLPEGWRETEVFGYIIPVPAEGTNDFTTYDNGDAAYSFKQFEGTNITQLAWMTSLEPTYKAFVDLAGLTTLKRHYKQSYVKRFSLLYAMSHLVKPADLSCVGFSSKNGLDLMYELWETQPRSFASICLENPATKKYHELILGGRPQWCEEERLELISRIRKAEQ